MARGIELILDDILNMIELIENKLVDPDNDEFLRLGIQRAG